MKKSMKEFSELLGKTITEIVGCSPGSEQVMFVCNDENTYVMDHTQDCCESVSVEDVAGDIGDLIGSPITMAEEAVSNENPEGVEKDYQDSFTWTFYKLATVKGYLTIRWYGESNGYYSEGVDFYLQGESKY
jgi:hypothetical protein